MAGFATFDHGVGISHDDGRITYRIAPDIDADRDLLTADLTAAKVVTTIYEVTGIGPTLDGRNGEGDIDYTDGEVKISVLVEGCNHRSATVACSATRRSWRPRIWRGMSSQKRPCRIGRSRAQK